MLKPKLSLSFKTKGNLDSMRKNKKGELWQHKSISKCIPKGNWLVIMAITKHHDLGHAL